MDSLVYEVVSWVGTFAVHSTILVGIVLLGFGSFPRREDALEESLLRFAMFGAVITATAQRTLGYPVIPSLEIDMGVLGAARDGVAGESHAVPAAIAAEPGGATPVAPGSWWSDLLPMGIVGYGLLVLAFAFWRLRGFRRFLRVVADRVPVTDAGLLRTLDDLKRRAGITSRVRLSTCDRLRSPVAFGLSRLEICLPAAVLARMDDGQQRCVLAHEMAHLRHGDTRWQLVYEIWCCVFLFQPLLLVARRRLQVLAEYRCDAWVVDQTRDRVGMARTLVDVAEWLSGGNRAPQGPVPAMAVGASSLASRVKRILDAAAPVRRRPAWVLTPLLCSVLAAFSFGVPGVRVAPVEIAVQGTDGTPRGPVQERLILLEREIAELHSRLAEAWLLLEGRDLPEVTTALRAMQRRLEQMTEERMALWREATDRIHRARWNSDRSEPNETEKPK